MIKVEITEELLRYDIVVVGMLFMEDHIQAVLPALEARRESCDAIIGAMSSGEIIRLTKLGPFRMDGSQKGPLAWLKKLRGSKTSSSGSARDMTTTGCLTGTRGTRGRLFWQR